MDDGAKVLLPVVLEVWSSAPIIALKESQFNICACKVSIQIINIASSLAIPGNAIGKEGSRRMAVGKKTG